MAKERPKLPTKPLPDLLAWWRKAKVRGVIIGGVAVAFRGEPRTTRDLDAIVFLDDVSLVRFLEQGKAFSFKPRIPDAMDFARENRILLMHHAKSETDVDLSLGGVIFEPSVLDRAQNVKVGRLMVPMATVEDLLVLKAIANRSIDQVDIFKLLELNESVDMAYVRRQLSDLACVLEMPEIVDEFERLIAPKPTKRASKKKRQ